jgi:hypothetical protein
LFSEGERISAVQSEDFWSAGDESSWGLKERGLLKLRYVKLKFALLQSPCSTLAECDSRSKEGMNEIKRIYKFATITLTKVKTFYPVQHEEQQTHIHRHI